MQVGVLVRVLARVFVGWCVALRIESLVRLTKSHANVQPCARAYSCVGDCFRVSAYVSCAPLHAYASKGDGVGVGAGADAGARAGDGVLMLLLLMLLQLQLQLLLMVLVLVLVMVLALVMACMLVWGSGLGVVGGACVGDEPGAGDCLRCWRLCQWLCVVPMLAMTFVSALACVLMLVMALVLVYVRGAGGVAAAAVAGASVSADVGGCDGVGACSWCW